MTRPRHKIKATAAALMLLVAQIFGLPMGFGCDCSGDYQLVRGPVCEADACHEGEPHHHDSLPCDSTGHEHEHSLVTADMSATQTRVDSLPQILPVLVCPIWEAPDVSPVIADRRPVAAEATRERSISASPPSGVLVKRSVVLLV